MFKIENIEVKNKIVLGPMAGITSLAYREFMKPFGVGVSVTEMVSDCGLIYGNEHTFDYIKTGTLDRPVGVQLFGNDSKRIIEAMDIVINSGAEFDFFDINLGCPVPKVTQAGSGSSLLKDTQKLGEFMKDIVSHSKKPVTAKIRLGWNDQSINFKENIKVLEDAGVAMIAIHARTAKQMYSGEPSYNLLKNLRDEMKVPLVVSGNIFTLDDAIDALEITHADAVMVARGGVGNPMLVKQIDTYFKTGERIPLPSMKENAEYLIKFMDMLIEEKGEFRAMKILRGIAPKFFNNYPGSKQLKNEIAQSINIREDLINILKKHEIIQ